MAPAQMAAIMSTRLAEGTRRLTRYLWDPYRPELHYMRGPGPKWREKYGRSATPPPAIDPGFSALTKAHS